MSSEIAPSIRFKEFADGWEKTKFADIFLFLQNNSLSRTELTEGEGNVFDLHYGDILTKFENVLDTEVTELPVIKDESIIEKFRTSLLQDGDIVIADTAEDETVGKCCEVVNASDKNILAGLHTMPCRPTLEFAAGYLGYYMNSDAFHGQLLPLMQGTKVTSISKAALQDTRVVFPSSMQEQSSIAKLFAALDDNLNLQEEKLNKLSQFKRSMQEKLFSKAEATAPEVRFDEFSIAWQTRPLSELTYFSGQKNRDNIPYESYSITNESGFIPQDEKFENGGTMAEADKSMYYIVSPCSFAYNPARINIGSIGYQNLNKNVIVSSLYEVFKTTDELDDRFLWHWFKTDNFRKLVYKYQEGGVRLYFYYDKLCMGKIRIPQIEEQRKIGAFLDNLDQLINLHNQKLSQLQHIKSALLDKMFVS